MSKHSWYFVPKRDPEIVWDIARRIFGSLSYCVGDEPIVSEEIPAHYDELPSRPSGSRNSPKRSREKKSKHNSGYL